MDSQFLMQSEEIQFFDRKYFIWWFKRWQHERFAGFWEFTVQRQLFSLLNIKGCHVTWRNFVSMRNQIGFKQYNPAKPTKYGILLKSINSAGLPYLHCAAMYGYIETNWKPWCILHILYAKLCETTFSRIESFSFTRRSKYFNGCPLYNTDSAFALGDKYHCVWNNGE